MQYRVRKLRHLRRADLDRLRRRMRRFYTSNRSYYEEAARGDKARFYAEIVNVCGLDAGEPRAVLELGVGRPAFPVYCREHGIRVEYQCQDVVPWEQNAAEFAHLVPRDCYYEGRFPQIEFERQYDVVFSTFVWEHVVNPHAFVQRIRDLVKPGGHAVFIGPRYDFPLYVNPAMRHFPFLKIIGFQVRSLVGGFLCRSEPSFYIVETPRCFAEPYRRDYDAVHNVLERDCDLAFKDWDKTRLRPANATLRGRLLERLLLLSVAYRKPGEL